METNLLHYTYYYYNNCTAVTTRRMVRSHRNTMHKCNSLKNDISLAPRKYALLVQCCSQKMKHCIHIQIKLRVNTRTYFCYKDEVHYIEKVLKFTCEIIRCLLNIPSRKHKNAFVVRNTWVIQQAYIPMVYT